VYLKLSLPQGLGALDEEQKRFQSDPSIDQGSVGGKISQCLNLRSSPASGVFHEEAMRL